MNTLRGLQPDWVIDDVLEPDDVLSAHDGQGQRYLMANTEGSTWLCAPITDRALECVASGRAELRAVFAHSSTGMVERLTVRGGTVCEESLMLCAELPDDVLPRPGVRLGCRSRCA